MKKFIVFMSSFVLLLTVFQIISGLLLTYLYTPDMTEAWNTTSSLTSETVISGGSPWLFISGIVISAGIAFFLSHKMKPKHDTE